MTDPIADMLTRVLWMVMQITAGYYILFISNS